MVMLNVTAAADVPEKVTAVMPPEAFTVETLIVISFAGLVPPRRIPRTGMEFPTLYPDPANVMEYDSPEYEPEAGVVIDKTAGSMFDD